MGRIEDSPSGDKKVWVPASVRPLTKQNPTGGKTSQAQKNQQTTKEPKTGTPVAGKKSGKTNGVNDKTEIPPAEFVGSSSVLDAIVGTHEKGKNTGEQGQGTKSSKAAEAAVVYTANVLMQKYRGRNPKTSMREFLKANNGLIGKTLDSLMQLPNSSFKETWRENAFNHVVSIFSVIDKEYGKISDIVWDSDEGRESVLGTSAKDRSDPSDLYVKVQGYGVVGVSLKKDGNVFFSNEGMESTLSRMAGYAPDTKTMSNLRGINNFHKNNTNRELRKLIGRFNENRIDLEREMLMLKRSNIRGAEGQKYDGFFDKNGRLSDSFTDIIFNNQDIELGRPSKNSSPGKLAKTSDALSLFTKCMETLDPESTQELRMIDRNTTRRLLTLVHEDRAVAETVKKTMVDAMKIPAMLKENPFGEDAGVRRLITIYGSAVEDDRGNKKPVYVDQKVLKDTFGPGIERDPTSVFEMDTVGDRAAGFIRLRVKNDSPPPNFFYPTTASVSLRARTKGKPASMEVKQHDAFTHAIKARSADPREWSNTSVRTNVQNTLNFLEDRLADNTLSDEETQAILQDVDFYSQLFSQSKR